MKHIINKRIASIDSLCINFLSYLSNFKEINIKDTFFQWKATKDINARQTVGNFMLLHWEKKTYFVIGNTSFQLY